MQSTNGHLHVTEWYLDKLVISIVKISACLNCSNEKFISLRLSNNGKVYLQLGVTAAVATYVSVVIFEFFSRSFSPSNADDRCRCYRYTLA